MIVEKQRVTLMVKKETVDLLKEMRRLNKCTMASIVDRAVVEHIHRYAETQTEKAKVFAKTVDKVYVQNGEN